VADLSTVTVMLLLRESFVFAVSCHSVALSPVQNNSLDAGVMCCNLPEYVVPVAMSFQLPAKSCLLCTQCLIYIIIQQTSLYFL
jgi:hypothetical protein